MVINCFFSSVVFGQNLKALNINYQYDTQQPTQVQWQTARVGQQVAVLYDVKSRADLSGFSFVWEKRRSLVNDSLSKFVYQDSIILSSANERKGKLSFSVSPNEKAWRLILKIRNDKEGSSQIFIKTIYLNNPTNGWVAMGKQAMAEKYFVAGQPLAVQFLSGAFQRGYYYRYPFPAALPPFVTGQYPLPALHVDSSFTRFSSPKKDGLYFCQTDSTSQSGIAFRVVSDVFPRFTKISDLTEPLLYICTADEYQSFRSANNDKAAFDAKILAMLGDRNRAKNFMKNYYQRVEQANLLFTSYKEGWKTDRGMLYILFGLPDEVKLLENGEQWNYLGLRAQFTFVHQGTVFDPDNVVLERNKRYQDLYFSQVDKWRKVRY